MFFQITKNRYPFSLSVDYIGCMMIFIWMKKDGQNDDQTGFHFSHITMVLLATRRKCNNNSHIQLLLSNRA